MLLKLKIALLSHHIFVDLNAIGSDRVLSLHQKAVHFETGFSLAVFSKTKIVEFTE